MARGIRRRRFRVKYFERPWYIVGNIGLAALTIIAASLSIAWNSLAWMIGSCEAAWQLGAVLRVSTKPLLTVPTKNLKVYFTRNIIPEEHWACHTTQALCSILHLLGGVMGIVNAALQDPIPPCIPLMFLSIGGFGYDLVLAARFTRFVGEEKLYAGVKKIIAWFKEMKLRRAALLIVGLLFAITAGALSATRNILDYCS